jgi:hypothetical protein
MVMVVLQEEYNTFTNLPLLSYNCINYLMQNNDLIWKLLKYSDSKAYEKSNLTLQEKSVLVYAGQANVNDFRVFSDYGQDDSILSEIAILRISVLELLPTNYVYGHVTMGMEVYSHYKINTMNNYTTRVDTIIQQLLEVFNGADIEGIGRLYFDMKANPRSRVSIIGQIPMKGKILTICNHMLG